MEVIIEIPEKMALALEEIVSSKKISRSDAIMTALDAYIKKHEIAKIKHDVFGVLENDKNIASGVSYQAVVRQQWQKRIV